MAITREDYKYVHNTLGGVKNKIDDGELKIGSKVENLLPELSDKNIYNSAYTDYYGKESNGRWDINYEVKNVEEKEIKLAETPKIVEATDTTIKCYSCTEVYSFNKSWEIRSVQIRNQDETLNLPRATIKSEGNNEYTITAYGINENTCQFAILDYLAIIPNTILNGTLTKFIDLEPNTSYVLQVINAVEPSNQTLPLMNTIRLSYFDGIENHFISHNFNQYIFFHTDDKYINTYLTINGLSFSYRIYGKDDNGIPYQLRSFVSPLQAKVYLFKSDMPWIVDKSGTIVSLANAPLQVPMQSNKQGIYESTVLTIKDIEQIFSKAPELKIIDPKELYIPLPEMTQDGQWPYQDLWKNTYNNISKPEAMDKLCLLAYRNFLTTETRDYNNTDYSMNYGLIKTIQRTKSSLGDTNHQQKYSFNTRQIKVVTNTDTGLQPIRLNVPNSDNKVVLDSTTTNATTYPVQNINLSILSLLGYNYTYTNQKQFNQDLKYRYTSVSFAWGIVYDDDNEENPTINVIRLSPFSKPLIIRRKEMENNKIDIVNLNLSESSTSGYYSEEAIYLE